MLRIAAFLSVSAAVPLCVATAQTPAAMAAPTFAAMKTLVGTWLVVDKPTSSLRIRFYLTAGGTVLVESWERSGQPYSLTLYHRDAASLIATHYCPQGNQPRLALMPSSRVNDVRFSFRDATDLDAEREAYLTALAFDLSNPKLIVRRESYRQHGLDSQSELRLVRDPS